MSGQFSIVMSGGGCKVFWATGMLELLRELLPPVDAWAGVSAGAGFALAHATGSTAAAFEPFIAATEANERNFYLRRALQRQRVCPHDNMYRAAMTEVFGGRDLSELKEHAPVYMFLSYIEEHERFVPASVNALQSFISRRRNHIYHGPSHLPPGFGIEVVSSHEAEDLQTLLDWTLMSSTIPPFTPIQRRAGRRYLDAGLIDNIPIRALPESARAKGSKILCLVSHHIPIPPHVSRWTEGAEVMYLAAREPLPIRVWDYTYPEGVRAAIALGQKDAEFYREQLRSFVGR